MENEIDILLDKLEEEHSYMHFDRSDVRVRQAAINAIKLGSTESSRMDFVRDGILSQGLAEVDE